MVWEGALGVSFSFSYTLDLSKDARVVDLWDEIVGDH